MLDIEIRPLESLDLAEITPIVTGYVSDYKYAVEKTENDEMTLFNIQLVKLDKPHRATFSDDFNEEDFNRFISFLPHGYSYGAYLNGKLIGLAIGEYVDWGNTMRIWEFQIQAEYRGKGVGRRLMEFVVGKARQAGIRMVWLETQNTNVHAIRFYRKLGFSLDALDLSFYSNHDVDQGEVAFFMKQAINE